MLCLDDRHKTYDLVYSLILWYTLSAGHEFMVVFHEIYRCHYVSFLACLHLIVPCCCKPHQQVFFANKIGWYNFLLISMTSALSVCCFSWAFSFEWQFSISYPYIFVQNLEKQVCKKSVFVGNENIPLVAHLDGYREGD